MLQEPWRIELLGGLTAQCGDDNRLTRFSTHKTACLLAYLACFPRRAHAREALREMLWPDGEPEASQASLRTALNSLRRRLEPPGVPAGCVLVTDRTHIRLRPDAFTTDVAEFETLVGAAGTAADRAARIDLLTRAIALYRGDLLPGFYEDWALEERERLAQVHAGALRRLSRDEAQNGGSGEHDTGRAIDSALRAVAADPLDEESRCALIRLYTEAGQYGDALRQYDALERLLRETLEETPSARTRALAESVRPLAEREKAETPLLPPATAAAIAAIRLPVPLTRFFGRTHETARIEAWLDHAPVRVITLTGPGGVGKTRLAVEIARGREFRSGGLVAFVPLADLRDPWLLFGAIAAALHLPRAASGPPPLEQIAQALADEKGNGGAAPLLVLDNLEQLLPDAAALVETLLQRVPHLTCLVTSRQTLGLPGERELPLPPLPTPHPATPLDRISGGAAVQLFVDRAQAGRPDFQLTPHNAAAIAGLCGRLEGLPLALELAGAWARVLTPAQIRERLDRGFELLVSRPSENRRAARHLTLRATIDWSTGMLPDTLRAFWRALSVFRGGWTVDAVEAIAPPDGGGALEYLARLRERSLVIAEEAGDVIRFRLLETLREYARDELTPDERAGLAGRHAAYYLTLAETAAPRLRGPDAASWLARLEAEHDNLRAALSAYAHEDGGENELRLAGALWHFWYIHDHADEGFARLTDALTRHEPTPTPARGQALHGAGTLALHREDHAAARALHEESLALWNALGEEKRAAMALGSLATAYLNQGDYAAAGRHYETALPIFRRLGEARSALSTLNNLGVLALSVNDIPRARVWFAEAVGMRAQVDDPRLAGYALNGLGVVAREKGDLAAARAAHDEALAIVTAMGDTWTIADTLNDLAGLAVASGDNAHAARLFAAVDAARATIAASPSAFERRERERLVALLRARLGAPAFDAAWAAGQAMTLDEAVGLARAAVADGAVADGAVADGAVADGAVADGASPPC